MPASWMMRIFFCRMICPTTNVNPNIVVWSRMDKLGTFEACSSSEAFGGSEVVFIVLFISVYKCVCVCVYTHMYIYIYSRVIRWFHNFVWNPCLPLLCRNRYMYIYFFSIFDLCMNWKSCAHMHKYHNNSSVLINNDIVSYITTEICIYFEWNFDSLILGYSGCL